MTLDHLSDRRSEEGVKSLAKVMRLLACFSTTRRSMTLAELCAATGYPRSTTHRLLASMRDAGLLDQARRRDEYRLGLKLFELGNIVLANMELHREARPFVENLSRMTGHSVRLAVFDGRRAVVVNRAEPSPESGTPLSLIESAPVHCTSVGKAILAFQPSEVIDRVIAAGLERYTDTTITNARALKKELSKIYADGYAVDDAEHQPGLRCIGAPIRDAAGRVIAGISVSAPARKIPASQIASLARVVMHHANQITAMQ